MIKLKQLLVESISSMSVPKKIVAHYQASDGHEKEEIFTNIEDLKKWIDDWVGLNGEISDAYNYIVSDDGVGRIHVKGLKSGELRTLLGREPLPKIQGKGYGKNLAKTTFLLNLPKNIHKFGKFETVYGGEGISYVVDFTGEPISNPRHYGDPLTNARLVFNINEDKWSGNMELSVSLFYTGTGWDQSRLVDKHIAFKSEGNMESDLKSTEQIFEIPLVKKALHYLENNTDKIKK